MSILSLASGDSAYRGYEYFKEKKVIKTKQSDENTYEGTVSGSNGTQYDVVIDVEHPRRSSCTCPHAAGRRIICKHMVALYFTLFPQEAKNYWRELEEAWERADRRQEEIEARLAKTIQSMKKSELQTALLDVLSDLQDWQYDRFIRTYVYTDDLY